MRKTINITLLILIFTTSKTYCQTDSIWKKAPSVHFSCFMDVFYAYDFNRPQGPHRQPFFFNHNRHNEFNLNLGYIKISLEHEKYRANLALQAGTYSNDNYAAEPGLLKNIFEANIGLSLNKKITFGLMWESCLRISVLKAPFRWIIGH